jgi:hypothetical protein
MQSRTVRWPPFAFFLLILGCSEPQGEPPAPPQSGEIKIEEVQPSTSEATAKAEDVKSADATPVATAAGAVGWAGVTIADAELKAEPSAQAPTLMSLTTGTPVTVQERQGGWYRVDADEHSGWLRMLAVTSDDTQAAAPGRRELEAAADIATGRSGAGNVVITTGIRGFDAEDLENAEPDWEAFARLESFALTSTEAAAAARALGLKAQTIDYLSRPKR